MRLADDDLPAGELRQVEGVQRLAALHQHVVGDVDHVVDRRDADRRQPLRRATPGSGRSSRRESPGPCSAGKARGIRARRLARSSTFVVPDLRRRPRAASAARSEQHGRFAGDADVPQAIGPVAGDFEVDRQVVADRRGRSRGSSPAIISRSASSAGVMSSVTYSFSQFQETSMGSVCDCERAAKCDRSKTAAGTARRSCRTRGCR